MGAPVPFREMAGAFIVDPPERRRRRSRARHHRMDQPLAGATRRRSCAPTIRVRSFVKLQPRLTFVMNGLSWPATERLTYQLGEKVRWRVINLSSQHHPMHLHGFYFDVESLGDGRARSAGGCRGPASRRHAAAALGMRP